MPSHSNSFGNNAEKDTAGCRALTRKYIVTGGNIIEYRRFGNTMNDEFYTHIHMSAGNSQGQVFGGHLNRAVVSATCETVVTVVFSRRP